MEKIWGAKNETPGSFVPVPKVGGSPNPDRVEVSNSKIYYYAGVCDDKILDLNKALNDGVIRAKQTSVVSEQPTHQSSKLFLHIQSGGGSIFAGIAGMDSIIQATRDVPVITIVDGYAASAGTFLSVVGTERWMRKHAYMLIHQLSSGFWGKYAEIKDEVENLDRLMHMIKGVYKEYTKVPTKEIDKILKRDIWWDAETCKRYGLIDKII